MKKNITFKRLVLLAALLMSMSFFSTDLYLPSMPAMVQAYGSSESVIQFSLSIYLIGFALAQLGFGLSSDRFGRKPILLIGTTIYCVASLALLLVPTSWMLLSGRLLQGIGAGAAGSLSRTIVRDKLSGKQLAVAYTTAAMVISLAPAVAPAIGGVVQHSFGYQANFAILFCYGLLVLAAIYFLLPETIMRKNPKALCRHELKQRFSAVLKHHSVLLNIVSNGFVFAIVLVVATVNPFIMKQHFAVNALDFGYYSLLIASGLVVGMFINTRLLKVFSISQAIGIGLTLLLVISVNFLALAWVEQLSLAGYLVSIWLLNVGVAILLPNIVSLAFEPFPQVAGLVGALYGCLQITICALLSTLIASLHITSVRGLAGFIFVIALTVFLSRVVRYYRQQVVEAVVS